MKILDYIIGFLFVWISIVCPIFDIVRHYLKEKKEVNDMSVFQNLYVELYRNPRVLTRQEYRLVKSMDWYNQRKFLIMHLTETGFDMYNNSFSEGRNGKWDHYLRIFELIQTPLFKAMNET
jgi:hypothetical protein